MKCRDCAKTRFPGGEGFKFSPASALRSGPFRAPPQLKRAWLGRGAKKPGHCVAGLFLAEREGFEPPLPFGKAVFKTAAIDHSATSPSAAAKVVLRNGVRAIFAPWHP